MKRTVGKNMSIKMQRKLFSIIALVFFMLVQCNSQTLAQALNAKIISKAVPCIEYKNKQCVVCPDNTHLYQQQCYQNIQNCQTYRYGSASADCLKTESKSPIVQIVNNQTSRLTVTNDSYFFSQTIVNNMNSSTSTSTRTISSSTSGASTISTTAALLNYKQLLVQQFKTDIYFSLCNNFMLRGQYSHFISRTTLNPIISAYYQIAKQFKQFKILYQGSGGNLLQCLIGINMQNNSIILRSFVTIGRTYIVDYCVDYTNVLECLRCKEGYHLDEVFGEKICVQNIPGCIQYYRDLCIKCRGYEFLIENRCISGCEAFADSRSIRCYAGIDIRNLNEVNSYLATNIQRNYFVG